MLQEQLCGAIMQGLLNSIGQIIWCNLSKRGHDCPKLTVTSATAYITDCPVQLLSGSTPVGFNSVRFEQRSTNFRCLRRQACSPCGLRVLKLAGVNLVLSLGLKESLLVSPT